MNTRRRVGNVVSRSLSGLFTFLNLSMICHSNDQSKRENARSLSRKDSTIYGAIHANLLHASNVAISKNGSFRSRFAYDWILLDLI